MKLEDYLKQHYSPKSAQNYLEDINHYLKHQSPEKALKATYSDILEYIGIQRKRNLSVGSLNRILQAIKKYYNYLSAAGARIEHPCKYLYLKDKQSQDVQLQDLFTAEELQLILTRAKEEKLTRQYYRNQAILSLLIHQGLKTGELTSLTIQNINLEAGMVYIKATSKSHARTLTLQPQQVMTLYHYLKEERPRLLKKENEKLIITLYGTSEQGRGIVHVVEQYKELFPERDLNPTSIRQSVIANKLKAGEDLRVTQAFAGHKRAKTTERYRQNDMEQFKNEIEKYHPLQ